MNFLAYLFCGAAFIGVGSAQLLLPVCGCDDLESCRKSYLDAIEPCADACQEHAIAAGADYPKLRACFLERKPQIKQTLQCAHESFEGACAGGPLPEPPVPKRFVETLKLAAIAEVDRLLEKSGVHGEVKHFVEKGKDFYGCMKKCMDNKANNCASKMNCGLKLPSDNNMVQNFKSCAIKNRFDTPGVHALCECGVKSGISKLESICGKLQIS